MWWGSQWERRESQWEVKREEKSEKGRELMKGILKDSELGMK